ncbi:hypothetical protein YC2023_092107 [Brassica napus]
MESPKKIAHEIGGVKRDALRFGLNGVKSDIVGSHPLESSYESVISLPPISISLFQLAIESGKRSHEAMKRAIIGHTYGTALPLKMDMDRQILSRFQRPPGPIPSSMLGLEVYTGAIDDFGFEDYLNDPRDSETFKPVDLHHGVEVRLGMSKGPVAPSFIVEQSENIVVEWIDD